MCGPAATSSRPPPLGLPSPLDPTSMPGSSLVIGLQGNRFTQSGEALSTCGTGTGSIEMRLLAIITDYGEDYVEFRIIEDFSGAASCGYPGVTADTCRAERLVSCVALP